MTTKYFAELAVGATYSLKGKIFRKGVPVEINVKDADVLKTRVYKHATLMPGGESKLMATRIFKFFKTDDKAQIEHLIDQAAHAERVEQLDDFMFSELRDADGNIIGDADSDVFEDYREDQEIKTKAKAGRPSKAQTEE